MITRNSGQALVGIILRMVPAMGGKPSRFIASISRSFLKFIGPIAASQGLPGLVKYLKTVSVQTQQYLGGYSDIPINPRVSRTKSGIPRCFPPVIRQGLRKFNTFFIRWSLTISSLYRDVVYEGPLKIKSITDPFNGKQSIFSELEKYIPIFTKAILKKGRIRISMREWASERYKAFPICTSSPQRDSDPVSSSSPLVLIRSALALPEDMVNAISVLSSIYRIDKSINPVNWIKWIREMPFFPSFVKPTSEYVGKLGLKVESAGKMRVFAMVDPWTQYVLAPIHKSLFHILGRIPQDGTFNQHRPLQAGFKGVKPWFSMDLSSATDRLPIQVQSSLLQDLLNLSDSETKAWRVLLVGRTYALSKRMQSLLGRNVPAVTYSVGQPMGALSSWAMLAYTHHFIVQVAAWKTRSVLPGDWFNDYAVLGDDIVIFNAAVSKKYHELITSLGVECNLSKSVISPKGLAMEFAKKTFIKGGIDVSPIPFKELYSSLESVPSLIEFGKKYHLSLSQLLKTAGFGYKVLGRLSSPLNKLNIKIQYIIFGSMVMDPQSLRDSFYSIRYFRNKAAVLKAFILFANKWTSETIAGMHKDVQILKTTHFWSQSKTTSLIGIAYGRDLYNMVYEPFIDKMIFLRESFIETVGQRIAVLQDFVKYDISYYTKRNLPVQTTSIVMNEISSILWETMKCYKKVISLPISSLSTKLEKSEHFSFGKGIPSLFNKHKTFINILHSKDLPMKESSLFPMLVLRPILRRIAFKKLGSITRSLLVRKLVTGGYFMLGSISAVCLSALIWGPHAVLALIGGLILSLQDTSSYLDWTGLGYIIGVIERFLLFIMFLSGIVIILKWNTIIPALTILKEQLEDGGDIINYLKEVIDLFYNSTVSLITELGTPVYDLLFLSPWYSSYTFGVLGGLILMYIIKWIFSF